MKQLIEVRYRIFVEVPVGHSAQHWLDEATQLYRQVLVPEFEQLGGERMTASINVREELP